MCDSWNKILFLKEHQDIWKILNDKFENEYKVKFMERDK